MKPNVDVLVLSLALIALATNSVANSVRIHNLETKMNLYHDTALPLD